MIPGGNGVVPQQPVNKLFSHNAVGVCPQPISVVLELHSCAVVANFLPQVLQLGRVLNNEYYVSTHIYLLKRLLLFIVRRVNIKSKLSL